MSDDFSEYKRALPDAESMIPARVPGLWAITFGGMFFGAHKLGCMYVPKRRSDLIVRTLLGVTGALIGHGFDRWQQISADKGYAFVEAYSEAHPKDFGDSDVKIKDLFLPWRPT